MYFPSQNVQVHINTPCQDHLFIINNHNALVTVLLEVATCNINYSLPGPNDGCTCSSSN